MQSQKLVSFLCVYLLFVKNAVAKSRVIMNYFLKEFQLAKLGNIFKKMLMSLESL